MTETTNIGLKIIEGTDILSRVPFNTNSEILDTEINTLKNKAALIDGLAATVTSLDNRVDNVESDVTTLSTTVTGNSSEINTLNQNMTVMSNNSRRVFSNNAVVNSVYRLAIVGSNPTVEDVSTYNPTTGVTTILAKRFNVVVPISAIQQGDISKIKVISACCYHTSGGDASLINKFEFTKMIADGNGNIIFTFISNSPNVDTSSLSYGIELCTLN